jgi:hypothetical protein
MKSAEWFGLANGQIALEHATGTESCIDTQGKSSRLRAVEPSGASVGLRISMFP